MAQRRSIILDCDPGQDDAVAILLALASPGEIDLRAITTVAGNVPLALTHRNARMMCELAGRTEVPVHAGCSRPILRPLHTAEMVHGKSGIDGAGLPEPTMTLAEGHAVDVIVDTLRGAGDGEITLCPMGPLTNIALAIVKAPELLPKVREIVLMGGSAAWGNTTPAAEFNIHVDPHAAAVVFGAGVPVVMHGLDVTMKALTTPPRLAAIRDLGSPVGDAVAGMLDFYNRFDRKRYGLDGGPLHDPCVIAYLLAPDLFTGRDCHVAIETTSETTMGRTVVDWHGIGRQPPNATVMHDIDADGFYALLTARLARL